MNSITTPDAVYASQLFRCGEGLPLWFPEPTKHGEVLIGDVGYMRHGAFYRLFNAMNRADHPINSTYGVPNESSYKPFVQSQFGLNQQPAAIAPGAICSKSLTKLAVSGEVGTHGIEAGFHFKCTDDQGALLVLKEAATREELHPSRRMANYMHQNFPSWYTYATETLDVDLQQEDIMFVRGWVKATQWAVAAITHEGREAKLSFTGDAGSLADAAFSIHKSQEVSNYYAHRSGPLGRPHKEHRHRHSSSSVQSEDRGEVKEREEHSSEHKMDQCIFLHYYKLKRRRFLGFKKLEAAAEPRDPSGPPEPDDFGVEAVPVVERPYDPVDAILDYILEHSDADVAIANDHDIIALCNGKEIPEDISAFLHGIQAQIEVNEDGLGMLSFETINLDLAPAQTGDAVSKLADGHPSEEAQIPPKVDNDTTDLGRSNVPNDNAEKKVIMQDVGPSTVLGIEADVHRGCVCALAYSPNGLYIASGFEDAAIVIWDAATGRRINELHEHSDAICSLAFSPNSSELVSGARDRCIIVWDVGLGQKSMQLMGHEGFVDSVAFSPNGRLIASASVDFTVRLWDAMTGAPLSVSAGHNAMVMLVVFSPNGSRLVSASADCIARIWDTATGEQLSVLRGHQGVIYSISFSPDNRRVVTGSDDGSSRIWHLESGEELVILREHTGSVWAATFSPDGKQLLTAASDRTVRICDSYSAEEISTIDGGDGLVNAPMFSADGQLVCAGAEDHSIRVWSVKTGQRIAVFEGHTDNISHLRFSRDAKRIASASDDSTVRVWNLPAAGPVPV